MRYSRLTSVLLRSAALFWTGALMFQTAEAADVGLKISAEKNWLSWGDYILGQDMKSGLERQGYSVQPAYMDNFYPFGAEKSPVDIYMHGFIPFNPPENPGKTNVLYLYYPLETANMDKFKNLKHTAEPNWMSLQTELWDFQLAAVASPGYQKELEKFGIKTVFVPQFTDPQKFFYEYDRNAAYDILFVGRPGYERISALWAIENGFDVALFGEGWEGKAPAEMVKGTYIDNKELHKYYASAKIVLNDTRADMKQAGFISNRVFDVTASGGFLISDYMPEIKEFYGDSIPMFNSKEELKQLLEHYLAHPEERKEKARQAQKITLRYFTNEAAARTIMNAVWELRKNTVEEESTAETGGILAGGNGADSAVAEEDGVPTGENGADGAEAETGGVSASKDGAIDTAVGDGISGGENGLDYNKLVIKSPWEATARNIGEYWLELDLEDGLRQSGFEVRNYYFNRQFYPDDFYDNAGNLLYMQFKYNQTDFEDERKNRIMYLYFPTEIPDTAKFKNTKDVFRYNTDISLNDELQYFDLIATPAKALLPELRKKGHKAVFVPQFTNPEKFRPEPDTALQSELLFVGSPWYERVSVTYAVEYGYDIAVYGLNWRGKIPDRFIRGDYVDNNILNKYYASAKIVLSDHPDDLAAMGLVINRLYDASAAGAFIISEYSPYIEEIFGDSIPMYKNKEEFKKLVDYYLAHPEERRKKALQARNITLHGYTNKAVGKQLKQLFDDIGRSRQ